MEGVRRGRRARGARGGRTRCRGDALAARAHAERGRRERLPGVRGEHGGRGHPQRAQLLHLPLQPPVLLGQRAEAPLQVLALHLRLLQLRPARHTSVFMLGYYIHTQRVVKLPQNITKTIENHCHMSNHDPMTGLLRVLIKLSVLTCTTRASRL